MAPVPIDTATASPTESKNGVYATEHPTGSSLGAYKSQEIRSRQSILDLVSIILRILTSGFTLIAFSIVASDTLKVNIGDQVLSVNETIHFDHFFYLSYLLTVNVITFAYALATIFLWFFLLSKNDLSILRTAIFALDLILSYLLMSASTSAATGLRILKTEVSLVNSLVSDYTSDISSGGFLTKAFVAVAFSYLAFFVLAPASLISGLRLVR